MSKPHFNQRFELPFKAVLLRVLDESHRPLFHASGFIRKEGNDLFLYTCWHVVTGYDKNDLKVTNSLPNRAFLEIDMKNVDQRQPGIEAIGGIQSLVIPLYDTTATPKKPLWLQDKRHIPHSDLNSIGIFVPFWHDAVKLCLPKSVKASDTLVIEESDVFPQSTLLTCGDKLYVVGFPYGFSATGADSPTPVVLTRFVASTQFGAARSGGRHQEILLESVGAPGMSGGPVFVERDSGIHLLGLYTGLLYPDHVIQKNEKNTALGTCSNMSLSLWGHLPLVDQPSES
jgi:hypothetical protein